MNEKFCVPNFKKELNNKIFYFISLVVSFHLWQSYIVKVKFLFSLFVIFHVELKMILINQSFID